MNYQAPKIEWQEPKNNEVIYDNNYQNNVICFWHNPVNSYFIRKNPDEKSPKPFVVAYGGRELKEMASVADAKEWVEQTHYPSALRKAGFKPVSQEALERLTLIEKLEQEVNRLLELKAQEKPHSLGYVFLGHHIAATVNAINIVKQHEAESEALDD